MNEAKYIGMDVHQATISVAVRDSRGNLVMKAILETKADTILELIHGLRGSLSVTFEEGTWAAWLHDLLQPHVTRVVACDPTQECPVESRKTAALFKRDEIWRLDGDRSGRVFHRRQNRSYWASAVHSHSSKRKLCGEN